MCYTGNVFAIAVLTINICNTMQIAINILFNFILFIFCKLLIKFSISMYVFHLVFYIMFQHLEQRGRRFTNSIIIIVMHTLFICLLNSFILSEYCFLEVCVCVCGGGGGCD